MTEGAEKRQLLLNKPDLIFFCSWQNNNDNKLFNSKKNESNSLGVCTELWLVQNVG